MPDEQPTYAEFMATWKQIEDIKEQQGDFCPEPSNEICGNCGQPLRYSHLTHMLGLCKDRFELPKVEQETVLEAKCIKIEDIAKLLTGDPRRPT